MHLIVAGFPRMNFSVVLGAQRSLEGALCESPTATYK